MTTYEQKADAIITAARLGQLPENVRAIAHDGLTQTCEAALQSIAVAKTFAAKVLDNTLANTEAVFDAAQAIAGAKNITEAAQLQTQFWQAQFAKAAEQGKELSELSAKWTQQTFATLKTSAKGSFSHLAT